MSARLFVVDGPGYLYRAYHALPYLSNSKGQPSNAVFGMSTMLWKLLRDESPEYAAVAWDPPGPTFREAKLPSYKETRPGMPSDRFMEALGFRRWMRRRGSKALKRLRSILEEGKGRGRRATIGGLDE